MVEPVSLIPIVFPVIKKIQVTACGLGGVTPVEDERAFTVRVAWEYADEFNAVWDKRAKMMMRILLLETSSTFRRNRL